MRGIRSRLTYANLVSTLALVIAVGGGAGYAADTVFSADIVDGEVKAEDIATAAVRTQELGTNQIRSADVRDDTLAGGGLTGADIAVNTLTSDDIAESTVHTNDILDATVLSKDLADGSVRSSEVLDDSLTGADIAADAVGSTEIADNSVTPAKLAVGATFINAPIFTNFDLPITCDGRPPEWYNLGANPHNAVRADHRRDAGLGDADRGAAHSPSVDAPGVAPGVDDRSAS